MRQVQALKKFLRKVRTRRGEFMFLRKLFSRVLGEQKNAPDSASQEQNQEKVLDEILMVQDRARITKAVLNMGEKTYSMLSQAFSVMESDDDNDALSVIEQDRQVDQMEMEINWECLGTMSMRQPVQDNLRFLFAVIKLTTDLERVGDESTNIARHLLKHRAVFAGIEDLSKIVAIRDCVLTQLSHTLTAFKNQDLSLAQEVFIQDEAIDSYYDKIYEDFLASVSTCDNKEVRRDAYLLTLARHLERAGDHVVNIAEYICFMLTGERTASDFDPTKT